MASRYILKSGNITICPSASGEGWHCGWTMAPTIAPLPNVQAPPILVPIVHVLCDMSVMTVGPPTKAILPIPSDKMLAIGLITIKHDLQKYGLPVYGDY